uniref:Nuclear autoantigenic sperm protein n=1 Tax=Seriola dumerili TaxID=41447 RepID=A0A3B4U0G3_SERDU
MEEANKLIGEGKKHLVMGKVVEAVSALQEACSMLAKKYGDTADECGEAFFWCGKALLDLARMENSVLGNALEGVPEEEEEAEADEEKPKDSKVESTENIDGEEEKWCRILRQSEDAEKSGDAEKAEAGKEQKVAKEEGGEKKKSEADESESAENEEKKGDEETEKESKEEDSADKTEDSDDEEVGNLQLAWEMLEVAKVIYKRKETKDDQLMAAQAHLKLGEVSSESGNYTQALEDFQECLKLQVKHLDSNSRLLAETHYQLGLTYSLNLQYSQAIEELNSSISVIKTRLDKLQELLDKAEGPEALPDERKEMEELKALLPEIQEKVEDATEGQKTVTTASEAVKVLMCRVSSDSIQINGTSTNGVSSTNGHTSAAPVSDISHLVRKKRKPEESPVKEGVLKKVKQDDGHTNGVKEQPHTDGVHKANGDTNGHTKSMEVERYVVAVLLFNAPSTVYNSEQVDRQDVGA